MRLPTLFIGHGNPMNALKDTAFTRSLKKFADALPRPKAVLCVSAHWMTEGSWVTAMDHPKTIHDFYGFPPELFAVQYPAPGSLEIATEIQETVPDHKINLDHEAWGLDHGSWSVLRHMYPNADIPVLQLSLYMAQDDQYHFELGNQLKRLRDQNILIVGSGNVVHNLRQIRWETDAPPYNWACEFETWVKQKVLQKDFVSVVNDSMKTEAGRLSIPSRDHWLPLLYVLGAAHSEDKAHIIHGGIENASISMLTFAFGD